MNLTDARLWLRRHTSVLYVNSWTEDRVTVQFSLTGKAKRWLDQHVRPRLTEALRRDLVAEIVGKGWQPSHLLTDTDHVKAQIERNKLQVQPWLEALPETGRIKRKLHDDATSVAIHRVPEADRILRNHESEKRYARRKV